MNATEYRVQTIIHTWRPLLIVLNFVCVVFCIYLIANVLKVSIYLLINFMRILTI